MWVRHDQDILNNVLGCANPNANLANGELWRSVSTFRSSKDVTSCKLDLEGEDKSL